MSKSEMIKGLQSLKKRIEQHYQDLWQYEEMLDEVISTIEVVERSRGMTRQEAIMHLDYLKDFKTPQQIEAINLAIKALNVTTEQSSMVGEWIDNGDRYFRCSLCGVKDTDPFRWCHGCGNKMKG